MTIKMKSEVIYTGDIKFNQWDLELSRVALEGFLRCPEGMPYAATFESLYKKIAQMEADIEFKGICEFVQENAA